MKAYKRDNPSVGACFKISLNESLLLQMIHLSTVPVSKF